MTIATTGPDGDGVMDGRSLDYTLGQIQTQLVTLTSMVEKLTSQNTLLSTELNTGLASLNNRVTVLETQKRSAPTWSTVVGSVAGLVAIFGFAFFILDRFYGK